MLSTGFKRGASVCAVAAATSVANVLAVIARSAAETAGSSGLPANARIESAKLRKLLLGCSSALAVSLLRALVPELQPLLEASVNRPAPKPRIVALHRSDEKTVQNSHLAVRTERQ
jgi:hypothetical protein